MSSDREGHISKPFPKEWVPVFSKDRKFKEDGSWKDNVEVDGGDDIGILVQEDEGSVPSFKTLEIEEYCEGATLDDLESGAGCAGQRRLAWLDDRSCDDRSSTLSVREYENPLTATGLYRLLKIWRFDVDNLSDADRRLIYIANLDPHYIRALGETASAHQVGPLRDAIWSHLFLETLIRVKVTPRGYPIFQMMLHIPYFALRASPLPKLSPRTAVHSNPPRQWMDLSFLEIQDQKRFIMHEAQITFLICGSDDQRWAAYAFDDTHFDEDYFGDETFSYEGVQDDPIARGKIDANLPIGDPREYFLMIFDIRLTQVREEWKYLVRRVELSIIKKRRRLNSSNLSRPSVTAGDRVEDPRKTLEWTRQTIDLLGQLQERLSETMEAWEGFKSSDGDIGYFADIDCSPDERQRRNCTETLASIKETFEILKNLQRKLVRLDQICQNLAQALQLLFIQESSEAAWDNTISSKLTVLLSPLALAATIFNIPQTVMPFPMTFKSLAIVVLIIVIVSFGALSAFRRRRKRTIPWMNAVPLDRTTRRFWTSGHVWRLGSRGVRNHSDSSLEGV